MALKIQSNMTIAEILEGTNQDIKDNIELLAKDYLEKKGKKLNKGCPSCVKEMVLTLKLYYMKTRFAFKRNAASYKNKKGDKVTISNSTMTDEKAIEFLRTKPERISLFSVFPKDWKKLIKEMPEQRDARIAAQAEIEAAEEAKKEAGNKEEGGQEETTDETDGDGEKPSREELLAKGLKVLRAEYPEIKATSTEDFVNKVLAE